MTSWSFSGFQVNPPVGFLCEKRPWHQQQNHTLRQSAHCSVLQRHVVQRFLFLKYEYDTYAASCSPESGQIVDVKVHLFDPRCFSKGILRMKCFKDLQKWFHFKDSHPPHPLFPPDFVAHHRCNEFRWMPGSSAGLGPASCNLGFWFSQWQRPVILPTLNKSL